MPATTIDPFAINWLAVLVLAVARNALGALWFSPVLFGPAYCRMNGIAPERMGEGMPRKVATEFVVNALTACVLAMAVRLAGAGGLSGLAAGVLAWAGFVATTSLAEVDLGRAARGLVVHQQRAASGRYSGMGLVLGLWR
jgi:hypothetical protein